MTALPTGTVMGTPVFSTSTPRTRPSVELMATARTWLRPMCCSTSAVSWKRWPSISVSMRRACISSGNSLSGNSTSMTGPMIWTTFPLTLIADSSCSPRRCYLSASAPLTTSSSSVVICAWRALL
jgi:hypothetical protein